MAVPAWMLKATLNAAKPKHSIIGRLKENLGGMRPGRARDVVHASDITKPDFCPRRWAFQDLEGKKTSPEFLQTAMDVTFDLGNLTAKVLIEKWLGTSAIGDWTCVKCGAQRALCPKPHTHPGCHNSLTPHLWEYREVRITAPAYGVSGSLDILVDVGAPGYMVTELKTMAPDEWEPLKMPKPEHRLRTNLYLHLIANSGSPYLDKFNLTEARVLYCCRAYGRMNPDWNEILPWKEFVVQRNDQDLVPILKLAKDLKAFREQKTMPPGICSTAFDKIAKKCHFCIECFSGKYPAGSEIIKIQTA